MRKTGLAFFCSLLLVHFLFSCSVLQNKTPNRIGLVTLRQYSLVNKNLLQDTTYMVIKSKTEFTNTFVATSGTNKPDLYGKTAVAIVLKNSSSLQFDSAEYIGTRINVYARTCSPSNEGCNPGNVFLATIPKVVDAKSVQFFINNNSRSTVGF
jgi:hypothetical protein